jgi:LacI family gluconate utilization system Gnt-I transcriptional repressor
LGHIRKKGTDRPVRVEDVAREAGVSPITVSRALSSPNMVRAETRARVIAAVQRTGYKVNPIASTLRSGRSHIVTMFVSSLRNPHFANAMQGMLDAFESSKYHLMFSHLPDPDDGQSDLLDSVLPFRPAAFVLSGLVSDPALRRSLREMGLPVMEMWDETDDPVDMLVTARAAEGGRLMGEHFVERGYKRVAYCGHTLGRGASRIEAFRAALEAGGAELGHVESLTQPGDFTSSVQVFDRIRAVLPGCDAIFYGSDVTASAALVAAVQQGLRVPDDIAIAGYGDLDFAAHLQPSLTTIRLSDYDMGRLAGQMLLRRLDGGHPGASVAYTPLRLEARQSTAPRQH